MRSSREGRGLQETAKQLRMMAGLGHLLGWPSTLGTPTGHLPGRPSHSGTPAGHFPGKPSNSGTLLRSGLGRPIWADQTRTIFLAFFSNKIATFILERRNMQKHSEKMLKKWSRTKLSKTFGKNTKKMVWKWSTLILDGRGRSRIARPTKEMPSGRSRIARPAREMPSGGAKLAWPAKQMTRSGHPPELLGCL